MWHYAGTARINDAPLPVYSERYADYFDARGCLLQYHGLTTIKATIDYEYQDSDVSTLLPRHEQIKYLPTLSEG